MGWIRWLGAGVLLVLVSTLLPLAAAGAVTPAAAVGDVVITEPYGQSETVQVEVPVTLSVPATGSVAARLANGRGHGRQRGFRRGQRPPHPRRRIVGGGIVVTIRADRAAESPETFAVELTAASGATLADAAGAVTIRDGAKNGGVSVGDVTVLEPDAGTAQVAVPLTIAIVPTKAVSVTWELRSATGTTGSDVVAASGTTTIPKGALTAVVRSRDPRRHHRRARRDRRLRRDVREGRRSGRRARVDRHPERRSRTASDPDTDTHPQADSHADADTDAHVAPTPTPVPGDFTWQPPAGSVPAQGTVLYVESAAGDYVGQGQTYLYTLANSLIGVSTTGSRIDLSIDGEEYWDASLVEPAGPAVVTGFWANLPGYTGGNAPALRFFGEGRSCISGSVNRFAVDEVTYENGSLQEPDRTLRAAMQRNGAAAARLPALRCQRSHDPAPPGDPAAFSWSPPSWVVPTSGNYLYYESQPGDYIGQGQTRMFTTYLATFTVTESSGHVRARTVQGNFDNWWDLDISGPDAQDQLVRGLYADVQRYPFHNPVEGGLDFSGDGRGCNELEATFAVDEVRTTPTACARVSVRSSSAATTAAPRCSGRSAGIETRASRRSRRHRADSADQRRGTLRRCASPWPRTMPGSRSRSRSSAGSARSGTRRWTSGPIPPNRSTTRM